MRLLPRRRTRRLPHEESTGRDVDTDESGFVETDTGATDTDESGFDETGSDDTEETQEIRLGEDTQPVPRLEADPAADEDDRRSEQSDPPGHDESTARVVRRRFRRRQWARRWLAWRHLVLAVLLVGVVSGAVWLVFFSSVLAVSGVQVEGTSVLASGVVKRVAEVPTGSPLATVDLDSVSGRVEELPAVKRVDVSRAWPDRVRIDVTERQVVAVVAPTEPGGRLRGTDDTGVLFRSFATRPPGVPLITTSKSTGADALAEAARVAGALPADIAGRVAAVSVRTVDTIELRLRNGRTVRWGSADDSTDKARVLAVLLDQKATFYDVSVPGQPVIRR